MDALHECCCGLDVHKQTVVACLLRTTAEGRRKELRTFGTMTDALLALADWLRAAGCTQVAMESTGVYWKPVFNILEGQGTVLVVNAAHIKAVPGRKTDMKLRHEVVSIAVAPTSVGRNLVFCHQYPTVACGRSNSAVRSPRDNVASPSRRPSPL